MRGGKKHEREAKGDIHVGGEESWETVSKRMNLL
jgi:hypothetical protein